MMTFFAVALFWISSLFAADVGGWYWLLVPFNAVGIAYNCRWLEQSSGRGE